MVDIRKKVRALKQIVKLLNINMNDTVQDVLDKFEDNELVKDGMLGIIESGVALKLGIEEFKNDYIIVKGEEMGLVRGVCEQFAAVFGKDRVIGIYNGIEVDNVSKEFLTELKNAIEERISE